MSDDDIELPKREIRYPAVLDGLHGKSGKIPESILVSVPGQAAGPAVRLVEPAARAWRALCAAAREAGITLKATSKYDSYRPYSIQKSTFLDRYTLTVLAGRPHKRWNDKTWYLKHGKAEAATPGASNHGYGLAVDTGEELDGDAGTRSLRTRSLRWLVANELRFGFSHETSERWHIHYFAGDAIPTAVLAYEQHGGVDMPLTNDEIEKIASAVWYRDVDPGQVKEMAWIALHRARLDAAEALSQIATLRQEVAADNDRAPVQESALLRGLLTKLSAAEIADAVVTTLVPEQAEEAAQLILEQVGPQTE
jgi:hypothetical protein